MSSVFAVQNYFMLAVMVGLLAIKGFALVNALMFPAAAYDAAGKLTRNAWVAILAVALVLQLPLTGGVFGILNLAGTIAAIVYLVDVRPALTSVLRR